MWSKRLQKFREDNQVFVGRAGFIEFVNIFHQSRDSGVERVTMEVGRDLFDDFVSDSDSRAIVGIFRDGIIEAKRPTAIQEAVNTADTLG